MFYENKCLFLHIKLVNSIPKCSYRNHLEQICCFAKEIYSDLGEIKYDITKSIQID